MRMMLGAAPGELPDSTVIAATTITQVNNITTIVLGCVPIAALGVAPRVR